MRGCRRAWAVAWLYWRVDERLGAYTGGFGGGVNAVASLLDCEAAGGRWSEVWDYGEGVCGAASGAAAAILCGGGQSGESEDGGVGAVWVGAIAVFCAGGLRAVDSAISL